MTENRPEIEGAAEEEARVHQGPPPESARVPLRAGGTGGNGRRAAIPDRPRRAPAPVQMKSRRFGKLVGFADTFFGFRLFHHLSPRQLHTHRLDLASAIFFGVTIGLMEILPGLIQSVLGGEAVAVGIMRLLRPSALLLTFYWASYIRSGPKMPWIVWSRTLGGLVLLAVAFFPTVPMVLLGMGVFLTVVLGTMPALNAFYKENYPERLRFQAVANIRIVTALSMAATGLIFGYYVGAGEGTVTRFSHIVFATGLASLAGIAIFRNIRIKSDRVYHRRKASARRAGTERNVMSRENFSLMALRRATWERLKGGFEKLFTDPVFGRLMIAWFVFGFSAHFFRPAFDVFLGQELGLDSRQMGWLYGLPYLIAAFTMRPWARLLDRLDVVTGRTLFTFLWLFTPLMMVFAALVPAYGILFACLSQIAYGFAFAGSALLWLLNATYFARDPNEAAQYMGAHTTLTGIRGFIAPALSVYVLKSLGWSYTLMFTLSTLGMVLSCLLSYRLMQQLKANAFGADATPLAMPSRDGRPKSAGV